MSIDGKVLERGFDFLVNEPLKSINEPFIMRFVQGNRFKFY